MDTFAIIEDTDGVGRGGPTGSLSPMDLLALAEMNDMEDESNATLANLMSSSIPIQAPTTQPPPPPSPPATTTDPTAQEWRAQ